MKQAVKCWAERLHLMGLEQPKEMTGKSLINE